MKKKIIVIGAGYAGVRTIERLANTKNTEILLFDIHPYHYMQTEVYDFIANETDLADITIDLFTFSAGFENVTFKKEEVIDIDADHKFIATSMQRYRYDYLVIAAGARTRFFDSIKGLKEYAYGIKSLHRALYFKQKFEFSLFKRIEEEGEYCDMLNIIIGGAGLSGVEIAAQMASFSREFYEKNSFLCRKLNIILIDAYEHILPGIDPLLREKSQKRLLDLEVTIKDNLKVVEVTKESVILSNGEVLPMDFMIFTGGIEASPLIARVSLQKDARGFLSVDRYLRAVGREDIYAIGDAAAIYREGVALAPTADLAEQMGEVCAQNIKRSINGIALVEEKIASRGILIALGRGYASAKVFGLYMHGYGAFLFKKAIEYLYAYQLKRRAKKGFERIFK